MDRRTVQKVDKVDKLLAKTYGGKKFHRRMEVLDVLVLTFLSQHTNDRNRDKAFAKLKERFPTWEAVLNASVCEIEKSIRSAGLSRQKAERIKETLKRIYKERGCLSLEFLGALHVEEALNYLRRFKGVGAKTAACVLMFGFNRPVFPVDTHIHRVTQRLGWIDENTSPEEAHRILDGLVPDAIKYQLHLNLIAHGRATCRPQKPLCPDCVIKDHCKHNCSGQ